MPHTLDTIELPQSVRELLVDDEDSAIEKEHAQLTRISLVIDGKRETAVNDRRNSGIEDVWTACEEAYIGIDNANRHEFGKAKWAKPMVMDAPVTTNERSPDAQEQPRSTIFIPLTARYVDAGVSKLQEILIATDDKVFSFDATPRPEMIDAKDNPLQVQKDGMPLERDQTPQELQAAQPMTSFMPGGNGSAPTAPQDPQQAPGVPLKVKDLVQEAIDLANKKAKKAETRVYDWLVECRHAMHFRHMLFDCGRIGVGVLKGPVPEMSRAMMAQKSEDGKTVTLVVKEKLVPVTKWVSPWNFFPDGSCGEDIHSGSFVFERDYLSPTQVRDLKKLPGYLPRQIDRVLKEGPNKDDSPDVDNPHRPEAGADKRYTVWYFYGTLETEDLKIIMDSGNKYAQPMKLPNKKTCFALITMINGHVIHATTNPLDSGKFPYRAMPWQRRAGHWAGRGVGEQVHPAQRGINAAVRALMDNAGLTAGVQLIIDREAIHPSDNIWSILRNKIWWKKVSSGPMDDVRKAMTAINIPSAQPQLAWIIEFFERIAEESTSIPLISQGRTGSPTPNTLGQTQMQDTNANQLLRGIGYEVDNHVTTGLINDFYEWLMLDPDVPADEKGDWTIFAKGSASLVERAIQSQTVAQWGELVLKGHQVFGVDPEKWFAEECRSKRLDPRKYQYDPAERERQKSQPPPPPPQVLAAQIKAQTDMKLDTEHNQLVHQEKMAELQMREKLAMLEYANAHALSLEQVKAKLADTTMRLTVQKELSAQDRLVDIKQQERDHDHDTQSQAIKPAAEPAGRAPAGKAFTQ